MSGFDPIPPFAHHAPLRLSADTWLIRQLHGEGTAPMAIYVNSLAITGAEPVIVDTGTQSQVLDLTTALPGQDPVVLPGQADLEAMIKALTAA